MISNQLEQKSNIVSTKKMKAAESIFFQGKKMKKKDEKYFFDPYGINSLIKIKDVEKLVSEKSFDLIKEKLLREYASQQDNEEVINFINNLENNLHLLQYDEQDNERNYADLKDYKYKIGKFLSTLQYTSYHMLHTELLSDENKNKDKTLENFKKMLDGCFVNEYFGEGVRGFSDYLFYEVKMDKNFQQYIFDLIATHNKHASGISHGLRYLYVSGLWNDENINRLLKHMVDGWEIGNGLNSICFYDITNGVNSGKITDGKVSDYNSIIKNQKAFDYMLKDSKNAHGIASVIGYLNKFKMDTPQNCNLVVENSKYAENLALLLSVSGMLISDFQEIIALKEYAHDLWSILFSLQGFPDLKLLNVENYQLILQCKEYLKELDNLKPSLYEWKPKNSQEKFRQLMIDFMAKHSIPAVANPIKTVQNDVKCDNNSIKIELNISANQLYFNQQSIKFNVGKKDNLEIKEHRNPKRK